MLQNYLFPNKKNNPKTDLAELGAAGKHTFAFTCTRMRSIVRNLVRLFPLGAEQERDWTMVATVQCRLDREGGTKLFTDLVMSTKNDKIFLESIQLAICLLEGGNTEIQVQSLKHSDNTWPELSLCHLTFYVYAAPLTLFVLFAEQNSFYKLMMGDNKSEKFFKVLHDRMKEAQNDIKATVSVNVGEMSNKANEKEMENGKIWHTAFFKVRLC